MEIYLIYKYLHKESKVTKNINKSILVTSFIHYCSDSIYSEIVNRCKSRGDDICIYHCSGALRPLCDIAQQAPFFSKKYFSCQECINSIYYIFHEKCNIPLSKIIPYSFSHDKISLPVQISYDDFTKLYYENFDYGLAVIGELATGLGKYRLQPSSHYDLYNNLSSIAINFYKNCIDFFYSQNIDEVFVFNGRLIGMRAPLRAAQQLNIPVSTFEFSGNNSYILAKNSYVQDQSAYKKQIEDTLSSKNFNAGKEFFEKQQTNINKFTSDFSKNTLPLDFNSNLINIVFFNTTQYEICSLREYVNEEFLPEQDSTLLMAAIAYYFQKNPQYHFYIRVHPNMKAEFSTQIEDLRILNNLSLPNLTIIWPEETVNSYTLMKNCQKVITFGSTTGIEATYWGIPSIVCGNNLCPCSEYAYYPKNMRELIDLIQDDDLPPKNQETAIRWGYFQQKKAIPLTLQTNGNKISLKNRFRQIISTIIKKFIKTDLDNLQRDISILQKQLKRYKIEYYKQSVSEDKKINLRRNIEKFLYDRIGEIND